MPKMVKPAARSSSRIAEACDKRKRKAIDSDSSLSPCPLSPLKTPPQSASRPPVQRYVPSSLEEIIAMKAEEVISPPQVVQKIKKKEKGKNHSGGWTAREAKLEMLTDLKFANGIEIGNNTRPKLGTFEKMKAIVSKEVVEGKDGIKQRKRRKTKEHKSKSRPEALQSDLPETLPMINKDVSEQRRRATIQSDHPITKGISSRKFAKVLRLVAGTCPPTDPPHNVKREAPARRPRVWAEVSYDYIP